MSLLECKVCSGDEYLQPCDSCWAGKITLNEFDKLLEANQLWHEIKSSQDKYDPDVFWDLYMYIKKEVLIVIMTDKSKNNFRYIDSRKSRVVWPAMMDRRFGPDRMDLDLASEMTEVIYEIDKDRTNESLRKETTPQARETWKAVDQAVDRALEWMKRKFREMTNVELFAQALSEISNKYGIFIADGNHFEGYILAGIPRNTKIEYYHNGGYLVHQWDCTGE